MKRVRQRVKELTPERRKHEDIQAVIASISPVLRGWGNYFRTGNAARKFKVRVYRDQDGKVDGEQGRRNLEGCWTGCSDPDDFGRRLPS
jgi:hypothetical protein